MAPIPTLIHEPDCGMPCVHLVGEMPSRIIVDRAAVGRLNFQPRITRPPQPVIAARRGDTLILSVNMLGKLDRSHAGQQRHHLTQHWYFDLAENPDNPATLIAVQREPDTSRAHG